MILAKYIQSETEESTLDQIWKELHPMFSLLLSFLSSFPQFLNMCEYKVIIIGDSNTGKTSIVNRYVKNTFLEDFFPTIGENLYHKDQEIKGNSIIFKLIDTAGVEDYGGITQFTIRDADAVIFTASWDSTESLESVNARWWETVTNVIHEGSFISMLCINKSDISSDDWEYTQDDARREALVHNMTYINVSAKDGSNVNELFMKIGELILEKGHKPKAPPKEAVVDIRQPIQDKSLIELEETDGASMVEKKKGCC